MVVQIKLKKKNSYTCLEYQFKAISSVLLTTVKYKGSNGAFLQKVKLKSQKLKHRAKVQLGARKDLDLTS